MINPDATIALRLLLAGERADAETYLSAWKGAPVAVATVARDVAVKEEADGALKLAGRFYPGATYWWVVAGAPAAGEVTVNGGAAPKSEPGHRKARCGDSLAAERRSESPPRAAGTRSASAEPLA